MQRRIHITIRGAVQGVGFRPFIYRLATELGLPGWVNNSPQGVFIEAEGEQPCLDLFLLRIEKEKPPRSFIQSLEYLLLDPAGYDRFTIRESETGGETSALILPDIAPCPDCLNDIRDPANRRYGYAFTNCTNCGPRYTIIKALPYDRANTTMAEFVMCDDCRREYEDPLNRRFHAQPNACPVCGPHLALLAPDGKKLSGADDEALALAAKALRKGKIIALKGIGGFQILLDARNVQAVRRLRRLKSREEKPFALMYPSVELARNDCAVSELEERLLRSPEAPIVLLDRIAKSFRSANDAAWDVSPGNPAFGVMLPSSPLHHLLLDSLGFPVVATSGNNSDEPICIDEFEALNRLGGMVDLFLIHNRPIHRHADDSIVRVMMGRELMMRRARGFAPLPVPTAFTGVPPLFAAGAHLKNTIGITAGDNLILSQHIGDLETREAYTTFQNTAADLCRMYAVDPSAAIADLHPDYLSSHFAQESGKPVVSIQHHYAHVAGCMGENRLEGSVLGVVWDGTGLGTDGTIWGGEFLLTDDVSFNRVGTFRSFMLPGADRAIKEPRRTALGMLFELYGEKAFQRRDLPPVAACTPAESIMFRQMLQKKLNAPRTSSAGRLFDAVSALIGLRQKMSFEGQAAMDLEFAIAGMNTDEIYPFQISSPNGSGTVECESPSMKYSEIRNLEHPAHGTQSAIVLDWSPMILQLLADYWNQLPVAFIAAKFHNTMAEVIVRMAKIVRQNRVVLSGGCFQNRYLTERAVRRLEAEGFTPYWHQRVPTNDGGIAFGQLCAYLRALKQPDEKPVSEKYKETTIVGK